jgi:hypothetical protein
MEDVLRERGLQPSLALEVWLMLWGLGQGLVSLHRAGRMEGGARAFRALARKLLRRSLYASLNEGAA